jgi:hypothetical protein
MIEQLKSAMEQLAFVTKMRDVVGNALSNDQQIAISKKIASNNDSFIDWAKTDEGRAAIRELANKFIKQ